MPHETAQFANLERSVMLEYPRSILQDACMQKATFMQNAKAASEAIAEGATGRADPSPVPGTGSGNGDRLGGVHASLSITVRQVMGVHPACLARRFRRHYGATVGGSVRGLRLEWAAKRLRETAVPIARIGARRASRIRAASRAFRSYAGVPPGAYRGRWRE